MRTRIVDQLALGLAKTPDQLAGLVRRRMPVITAI
jgi:hypothetical protein